MTSSISDSWITELVWGGAQVATLYLDLGFFAGLRLLFSFGLGFSCEPYGVFAACLPCGLLYREAHRSLVGPR